KDDEIPDLNDDDVDLVDDDTFLSHDEDDDVTDILGNGVSNDDDI
ncbi:MAG: TIGR02300 family protein, partial [Bartonella sp.]|nr:TIGR02300 family protein [Bartonella sp.]